MPPYNPTNDFYLRQTQMSQPQFQPHGQRQEQFIVIPVSNIEEARNAIINPMSTYLFVDYSTGKIYFKRMGNNGLAEFITYSIQEEVKEEKTDHFSEINQRLSNIETYLGGLNESISVNGQSATVSQSAVAEPPQSNGAAEPTGLPKMAGNDKWKKRN